GTPSARISAIDVYSAHGGITKRHPSRHALIVEIGRINPAIVGGRLDREPEPRQRKGGRKRNGGRTGDSEASEQCVLERRRLGQGAEHAAQYRAAIDYRGAVAGLLPITIIAPAQAELEL